MKKLLSFMVATSFVTACTTYPTQKPGSPQAILNIDGTAGLTAASGWGVYDNSCLNNNDKSGSLAVTGNLSGRKKQVVIAADLPVFLLAGTFTSSSSTIYNQININSCSSRIKFLPENGKIYDVKLLADQCHVSLLDHQTMLTPANTEFITNDNWKKYTADCKQK